MGNLEDLTEKNDSFRQVVYTGKHAQLVVMCLKPGEEIGMEVHQAVDQFFRFEEGEGKVVIDGVEQVVKTGFAAIVPAGANHNVVNVSPSEDLKLYTLYSPAEHLRGTVRKTKAEAEANPEEFDGITDE